jgi:hypothetical protein
MKRASYPSPFQRIAIERAIRAIEDEARGHYFGADVLAEEARAALNESNRAWAFYLRRRADARRRRAEELQHTADELSKQTKERA